jgi:CheY-like chemotaxis protein
MTVKAKPVAILMADDDPEDQSLARQALEVAKLSNPLYCVNDGEELMDFLKHRGEYAAPGSSPRPGIILLDLNMPRKGGRRALAEIKADRDICAIPVIILTTSAAEEDLISCYQLGTSGFVTKPVSFDGLVKVMRTLADYWFEIVQLPKHD